MLKVNEIKYIEDIVIQVNWEYSLEGFESISGTLELPAPIKEIFIPLADITEEICLGWVREFVNPESMQLQEIETVPEIKTITFN